MSDAQNFRLSRKGYDPADVDRAFAEITSRVTLAQQQREEADRAIDRLTRELNEARSAVKRANAKPSFSDLGAAFEQTLRVAEEQAGKLLQDATRESQEVREAAKAEAEKLITAAEKQADKLDAEATKRVDRIRIDSERQAADIVAVAEKRLNEARISLEEARTRALEIEREAEVKAVDISSAVVEENEQARAEMQTLRELNDREQLRIQREIETLQEKDERENRRLAEQSSAYIAEITREANDQVVEADARAAQLVREAEEALARARVDGDALVRGSQETAAGIVSRARVRATNINRQLENYAETLLTESDARLAELDEQREGIVDFRVDMREALDGVSEDNALADTVDLTPFEVADVNEEEN